MSAGEVTTRRPWYLKWWVILIGVLLVVGIVGYALGGGRGEPNASQSGPPAATDPASSPGPGSSEGEIDPEPAGTGDVERGEQFEAALREAFAGQSYSEVFASDPSGWYGWISGVRVEGANAYVTLQVGSNDAERGELGQRAAKAIPMLLAGDALNGISWVIVEDASNGVIDQSMVG